MNHAILSPHQIIAMKHVRRWHTCGVLREQSVAEHSHQVALLALYLAPESLGAEERLQIVMLALLHDAHETKFGDVPYPTKKALLAKDIDIDGISREMFWAGQDPHDQVEPHVRLLVDVADILEAALYAQRWVPEEAPEVVQQAIDAAQRLSTPGFLKVARCLRGGFCR